MTDGGPVVSVQDAFALAVAELEQASSGETPAPLPGDGTQAEAGAEQAPGLTTDDGQSKAGTVDDLLGELEGSQPTLAVDPSKPEFWQLEVEVATDEGPKRMSLKDMRDGAMMRADYTRKTQEVARERQLVKEAVEFHQAFRDNPMDFARYLAGKAGLIEEGTQVPNTSIKVYTEDEIEVKVAERLEKAVQEHPEVLAARNVTALTAVDQVFAGIEAKYASPISPANRLKVLEEATRRGTTDIELVFESMLLRASQNAAERNKARQAAPPSGGMGGGITPPSAPPAINSVEDAFKLAMKELSGTVA